MTHKLYELLAALDERGRHYTLHRVQDDQVMILVTLVGQRVEIYVSSNGDVGYSAFAGDESVKGDSAALLTLLEQE